MLTDLGRQQGTLLTEVVKRYKVGSHPPPPGYWYLKFRAFKEKDFRVSSLIRTVHPSLWLVYKILLPLLFAFFHSPSHCVENLVLQYLRLSVVFSLKPIVIQFSPSVTLPTLILFKR